MTQRLLEEIGGIFRSVSSPVGPSGLASALPRGPRVRVGAARAPRIPGRGGERGGRPGEQLAARWPGSERPELGEEPGRAAGSQSLAFCAATFPSPSGSHAVPAPAPRARCPGKVCVPGPTERWRLCVAAGLGKLGHTGVLWQLRPLRRAAP
jgi:hypothetical protein